MSNITINDSPTLTDISELMREHGLGHPVPPSILLRLLVRPNHRPYAGVDDGQWRAELSASQDKYGVLWGGMHDLVWCPSRLVGALYEEFGPLGTPQDWLWHTYQELLDHEASESGGKYPTSARLRPESLRFTEDERARLWIWLALGRMAPRQRQALWERTEAEIERVLSGDSECSESEVKRALALARAGGERDHRVDELQEMIAAVFSSSEAR